MSATCVMDDVANLRLFGVFWFSFLMNHVKQMLMSAGDLLFAAVINKVISDIVNSKTLNCSQLNVPKNAPEHLTVQQIEYCQVQHRFEQPNHNGRRVKQERWYPWCCLDWSFNITAMKPMAMPLDAIYIRPNAVEEIKSVGNISGPTALTNLLLYSGGMISMLFIGYLGVLVLAGGSLAIEFANITGYSRAMISMLFILHPCVTEAAKHIELGPNGAADTHLVPAINDGTGDLASGGIGTGAPDISIPIGNDVAPDTSIPVGNASDSVGDSNSEAIGTGDPSDPDGDSNNGSVEHGRDRVPSQDFTNGIFFLFMAMIAEFAPNLMQLAGSTHKHNLKLLLWGIDMSAAGCFFTSCFGLLGEVLRMVDCRLFSRSSFQKVQNFIIVAASTFMMTSMILVFAFIAEAMV